MARMMPWTSALVLAQASGVPAIAWKIGMRPSICTPRKSMKGSRMQAGILFHSRPASRNGMRIRSRMACAISPSASTMVSRKRENDWAVVLTHLTKSPSLPLAQSAKSL